MTERWSSAQFEAAIASAIADHKFEAALALLRMLAVQDPDRACIVLAVLEAAIAEATKRVGS